MNLGNAMLLIYIILGGVGLWLGEGTQDLLDLGTRQEVINLLSNAVDKGVYIAGAVMIYILKKKAEELPPPTYIVNSEGQPVVLSNGKAVSKNIDKLV